MAKQVYRYYSEVRAVQIHDEIENDVDFAVSILDELATKYPFLHFQLHIHMNEEQAGDFLRNACTYTTNIKYQD